MNAVAKDVVIDILKAKGSTLRIADDLEILDSLATIREHWERLRDLPDSRTPSTVIELIEHLAAQAEDGPLVKLLIDAGLPGKKLRAALAKIADVFGKVDAKYHSLLMPLASFDEDAANQNVGLVEWKLVGLEKPVPGAVDDVDYSIDLGAHASLLLEAGDMWPDDEPGVPDPLLRIGFVGGLSVSARAALPLSFGALKLGAGAESEAALDYYFDARESDDLYARAVFSRLGELPNPWSLTSVMQAVERADFVGAVLETQSGTAFSVDVSVAEGFALAAELESNVGLSFGAKITRRGTHYVKLRSLSATMESAAALEVTLERKRTTDRERTLELGIEVDAAALGRRLAKVLERHEGMLKGVLDEYRDFLTPGTYLTEHASAHLSTFIENLTADAQMRSALKDAAQLALGLGKAPTAANLQKFLEEQVADLLEGASGVIGGAVEGVARQAAATFAVRLDLPPELADRLVAEQRALIERIREDLEERVKAAVGASSSKLIKQLDAAGVKVTAAGNRGDNAFAAVTEVIARYERALDRLRTAVTDAARMRLTAQITAESDNVRERTVEAKLVFKTDSPGAREVYRRVLAGDFDTILQLLDDGHPDVVVDLEATTLMAFKSGGRQVGYAFVLLGFELGGSVAFDTSSKVLVEGSGKVSVISELTWKRRRNMPREQREISFVDAFELAVAKHTQHFRIDLALQHEDERLKRREVEKLIASFERAQLVPSGTTARALTVFDEWFGTGDVKIAADIDFALRMEGKAAARLLCLAERAGETIANAGRRRIFGVVLQELIQSGAHEQQHIVELASLVHAHRKGEGAPSVVDVLYGYTSKEHHRLLASPDISRTNSGARQDLSRAHGLHKRCMSFVDLIDRMGDVYEATPSIARGSGWTERDYDDAQRDIAQHLKSWLKTSSRLFWISADAHPVTVAFIGALTALAETDDAEGSVLSVSMTRRTLEPVTVTLC